MWVTVIGRLYRETCRYGVEKTVDTHKILINAIKFCLSSRNMIDKTMCEVLWRNISDFYGNLPVKVGKHPQVILAMYFYLGQEGNFSDVFLSWTRIMSVLIGWPI
jgi:hypothetical protein